MSITRQEAIQIGREVEEALASIFAAHGMEKPRINTRYGSYLTIKIDASKMVAGENGVNTASVEAQAYALECRYNPDLDPEAVGKEYTLNFKQYVFVGYAPRSRKYPFLFRNVADGKVYKFTSHYASFLKKAPAAAGV